MGAMIFYQHRILLLQNEGFKSEKTEKDKKKGLPKNHLGQPLLTKIKYPAMLLIA